MVRTRLGFNKIGQAVKRHSEIPGFNRYHNKDFASKIEKSFLGIQKPRCGVIIKRQYNEYLFNLLNNADVNARVKATRINFNKLADRRDSFKAKNIRGQSIIKMCKSKRLSYVPQYNSHKKVHDVNFSMPSAKAKLYYGRLTSAILSKQKSRDINEIEKSQKREIMSFSSPSIIRNEDLSYSIPQFRIEIKKYHS